LGIIGFKPFLGREYYQVLEIPWPFGIPNFHQIGHGFKFIYGEVYSIPVFWSKNGGKPFKKGKRDPFIGPFFFYNKKLGKSSYLGGRGFLRP